MLRKLHPFFPSETDMNDGLAFRPVMDHREQGPWPFVTRRSITHGDTHWVWRSRPNRKGLDLFAREGGQGRSPFWKVASYNWSIGAIFAAGSFLFMLGSVLSLPPAQAAGVSSLVANVTFFIGSIPFSIAAYLQLLQAANTSDFRVDGQPVPEKAVALIGWYPRNAGWLSSFCQFLGTLAFNVDTLNAVIYPAAWYLKDVEIWVPNMVGSILFLVSGYLAFIEAGHRYWTWKPSDLSWQIVFINLLGCIAFMVSALLAYYPSGTEAAWIVTVSTLNTLAGAACFFIAALLTCRESGWWGSRGFRA